MSAENKTVACEAVEDMRARKDAAYEERNKVVAALARLFPSGLKQTDIPGWDPEWHGAIYIDLPTGQVSWHYHVSQGHLFNGLPAYQGAWDGHDTPEKYRRLAALTGPARDGGDQGRDPNGSGSRPSDQAASRLAPEGFDPSRGAADLDRSLTNADRLIITASYHSEKLGEAVVREITGFAYDWQDEVEDLRAQSLCWKATLEDTQAIADDLADACLKEGQDKAAGALQFISGFIGDKLAASAQGTEAGTAETGTGSVHDGPVPVGHAPSTPDHPPTGSRSPAIGGEDDLAASYARATPGPWIPSKRGYQILTGDSWNTICTFHGDGKDHRLAAWEDGRGAAEPSSNAVFISALVNAYCSGRLVSRTAAQAAPDGTGPGWTKPHRGYVNPVTEAAARRIAARRAGDAYCDAPDVSEDAWRSEIHAAEAALFGMRELAAAPAAPAQAGGDGWSYDMNAAPKDGTKVDLMFPWPRGRTINCYHEDSQITGGPMWLWRTPKWKPGELTPLPESEWPISCYPNMQPYAWRLAAEPPAPPSTETEGR